MKRLAVNLAVATGLVAAALAAPAVAEVKTTHLVCVGKVFYGKVRPSEAETRHIIIFENTGVAIANDGWRDYSVDASSRGWKGVVYHSNGRTIEQSFSIDRYTGEAFIYNTEPEFNNFNGKCRLADRLF